MDITSFKAKVAAYANRSVASFVINGFDVLLDAVNDVHREAQQTYQFKRAQGLGFCTTDSYGRNLQTSVYSGIAGTGTVLAVKNIQAAWMYTLPGTDNTQYTRVKQYDIIRQSDLANMYFHSDEYPRYPQTNLALPARLRQQRVYLQAGKIYITGTPNGIGSAPQTQDLLLDLTLKMPDYVPGTVDTDFLITEYQSWMLLKTLERLNLFMKEDQRFQITMAAMQRAWEVVTGDDENIEDTANDLNSLD